MLILGLWPPLIRSDISTCGFGRFRVVITALRVHADGRGIRFTSCTISLHL